MFHSKGAQLLTDHTQTVSLGESKSDHVQLTYSVPQGSVLGPELYVQYKKKLAAILILFLILYHFYADDSQLYKSLKPDKIEDQINCFYHLQNVSSTPQEINKNIIC